RNPEWVRVGALSAELKRLAFAAFSQRADHFSAEKKFLARTLVPLILARALFHLRAGKRVVVFCDSGTTLYPAFQYLADFLPDLIAAEPNMSRFVLIANNVPGGQLYMTRAK